MRERDGPFVIRHGKQLWLDETHSSFRMPRCMAKQCSVKGCFHTTSLVYCQQHYPVLIGGGHAVSENMQKFIDICNCTRNEPREYGKSIVLLMDFCTLNWEYVKTWPRLYNIWRDKMADILRDCGITSEMYIRYAFMVDDDEFAPTVHPLNVGYDGVSELTAKPLPDTPATRVVSRHKVAAAAEWLTSTGVVVMKN